MTDRRRTAAGCAALLLLAAPARAEPAAAPTGASSCVGCHGAAGRAGGGGGAIPPLAGRPAEEIAGAMRAYRTGERPATVMDRIARGFTEEESRAIAAWVAAGRR